MAKHKVLPKDFICANHGSIIILVPLTAAAKDWVEEYVDYDQTWMGNGIVIEPRYFDPILEGIHEAGLTVA